MMYCERHKIGITYDGDEVSRTDCPFCMLESKHGVIFKKVVEREIMEKKLQKFESDSQVGLVDYLDEFIVALRKQLHEDFLRWGNTWLNRPKKGQELRTKARYIDYFDMFELGKPGIPVPWLKVIGGALICWIRDQHPELCPDISIAEEAEMLVDACTCKGVDGTIKVLGHAGPCEVEKPVEETTSSCPISGESDCESCEAECTKDRNFWKVDCNCQDCNLPDIKVPTPISFTTGKALLVAHVANERITDVRQGRLEFLYGYGKILFETVEFTNGIGPKALVLARCALDGTLITHSRQIGIIGIVFEDGRYQFRAIRGVKATDTIYVSYDYT